MLSLTDVRKIKLLDRVNLVNLLADIDFTENDTYEFKAEFYSGAKGNEECRKDFSAFANNLGGFIFIGVDDSKNICGDNISEINKKIDDKLKPLGKGLDWFSLRTIDIGDGKYVYIFAIEEVRHYWEKPLISDSVIYIRGKGCVKTLNSIGDASNAFDLSRFLPTDIRYFEELLDSRSDELDMWSAKATKVPMYYARIFTCCDVFLAGELRNATTSETQRDLKNIITSYRRWSETLDSIDIKTSIAIESTGLTLQASKSDETRTKLKDFIEKFNKTYKYE